MAFRWLPAGTPSLSNNTFRGWFININNFYVRGPLHWCVELSSVLLWGQGRVRGWGWGLCLLHCLLHCKQNWIIAFAIQDLSNNFIKVPTKNKPLPELSPTMSSGSGKLYCAVCGGSIRGTTCSVWHLPIQTRSTMLLITDFANPGISKMKWLI